MSRLKKIYILTALLLFASVGAYLIFSSNAAGSGEGMIYHRNELAPQPGETFNLTIYANTYTLVSGESALYLNIGLITRDDEISLQQPSICNPTANPAMSCSAGAAHSSNPPAPPTNLVAYYCIKFDPSMFGKRKVPILSMTYTARKPLPYKWGGRVTWSTSSRCYTYQVMNKPNADYGISGEIAAKGGANECTISCSTGTTPGDGEGSGGTGIGLDGQGLGIGPGPGSGGGGGGSTANRQSDNQDSIPSSSPQGDNEQTELEPSPFYDGKEFKPGSDPDSVVGAVSSTGKKLVRTWPTVLVVLVLGGAAGFGYWKWRKR